MEQQDSQTLETIVDEEIERSISKGLDGVETRKLGMLLKKALPKAIERGLKAGNAVVPREEAIEKEFTHTLSLFINHATKSKLDATLTTELGESIKERIKPTWNGMIQKYMTNLVKNVEFEMERDSQPPHPRNKLLSMDEFACMYLRNEGETK